MRPGIDRNMSCAVGDFAWHLSHFGGDVFFWLLMHEQSAPGSLSSTHKSLGMNNVRNVLSFCQIFSFSNSSLCSTPQVNQWNAHLCVAAVTSGSLRGAAGLEETSEEGYRVLVSSGKAHSCPRQGCVLSHWEQRSLAGKVPLASIYKHWMRRE